MTSIVTTHKVTIVGLGLAAAGIALLAIGAAMNPANWGPALVEVVKSLGGTLFATATLALVWELFARRAFTREVLTYIKMSEDLEDAGVQQISWKYLTVADWSSLFARTRKLDLFLSYARTWRNTYHADLEGLAARRGVTIRVIHPDPNDELTMQELARRFSTDAATVRQNVRESDDYFKDLATRYPRDATISRYFVASCPLISMYIFSAQAVLALYTHSRRRQDVPTMLVESGKSMYAYMEAEFASLLQQATLLTPPPAPAAATAQAAQAPAAPTQNPAAPPSVPAPVP